jgi:hypothetical protein
VTQPSKNGNAGSILCIPTQMSQPILSQPEALPIGRRWGSRTSWTPSAVARANRTKAPRGEVNPPDGASKRLATQKRARHKPGLEEHLQSLALEALRREPIVDFLSGLILGQAVALLDLPFEFLTAAVDGS